MGKSQTKTDGREVEQEVGSQLHDQATALASEVRQLRESYERLVARIDEALAPGQTGKAAGVRASHPGEAASGRELYLLNLAASGFTREDAATHFAEQFGEGDDELVDKVFESAPTPEPPRRGRRRRQ